MLLPSGEPISTKSQDNNLARGWGGERESADFRFFLLRGQRGLVNFLFVQTRGEWGSGIYADLSDYVLMNMQIWRILIFFFLIMTKFDYTFCLN